MLCAPKVPSPAAPTRLSAAPRQSNFSVSRSSSAVTSANRVGPVCAFSIPGRKWTLPRQDTLPLVCAAGLHGFSPLRSGCRTGKP